MLGDDPFNKVADLSHQRAIRSTVAIRWLIWIVVHLLAVYADPI